MQRLTSVSLLVTVVMGLVAGAVLSLTDLVGHRALSAGLFAIVMVGFAAVMLHFAVAVPIVRTFLVFDLALSVRSVPEIMLVVVGRRRMFTVVWRRRWVTVMVRRMRRSRLCADLRRRPQREKQERRDHCDFNCLPHLIL